MELFALAVTDAVLKAGDIVRYFSFALCSGRWVSIVLPVWVAFSNWATLTFVQPKGQQERYGADFDKYASQTPLLVPCTTPAKPAARGGASSKAAAENK